MKTISLLTVATLACATVASNARAHIGMTGNIKSRTDSGGFDDAQKSFPCDGARGDGPIYTFEPGSTIKLSFTESIPHPGYYRIAFDRDGEDDFMDPRSIKPLDPNRECKYDDTDQCEKSDYCNNESVLFDNLNPHISSGLGTSVSWNIKLPDVECDNCTLQIIQVMEDTSHGGYCPIDTCSGHERSAADVYHRCIDLKLVKGAKNSAGTTTEPVTLPADKKYLECSKQAPGEPTETTDAGKGLEPTKSDAGDKPSEPTDDDSDASVDTNTETGVKVDAGVKDAGVKKDAGTAKDAGKVIDESDDEDAAPVAKDDGCALASSPESAAWTLLSVGLLLARRRRHGSRRNVG
jgi:MYXO-CTERM domain-containing protein